MARWRTGPLLAWRAALCISLGCAWSAEQLSPQVVVLDEGSKPVRYNLEPKRTTLTLGEAEAAGRRGRRAPPSAGGSFALFGSSNRAGNDEMAESDLDLGESQTVQNSVSSIGSSCTRDDMFKVWNYAWNKGYASAFSPDTHCTGTSATGTPSHLATSKASHPSWGCPENHIYLSEWLIRDEHRGCFLVWDKYHNQHDMSDVAHNRDFSKELEAALPPGASNHHHDNKTNKMFWKFACSDVRKMVSYALLQGGMCGPVKDGERCPTGDVLVDGKKSNSDMSHGIPAECLRNVKCPKKRSCYKGPKPRMGCLKDRDEIPDITRVFDGFKWDVLETEKCGKFRQHPMQGPDWFRYSLSSPKWYYARLNKNGIGERNCRLENSDKVMPYDTLHTMLGIAKDNLAGRCVNRDETFVTSGLVPLATIPGLCVDARGNCQCYDGRQAPRMATLDSAWTFYKMASSLMSGIHIIDELVCYNSPTFSCVLRIWEDWAAEKNGRQATYTKNTRKSTRKKNILEDESQKPKLYTLKDREAIWAQLPEGTQKVLQNQWDKCKKYGEAGEDPLTLDDPNAFKAFDDDVTDPPQHSESMLGESEQWGRMIAHQVSRAKKSSPGMVAGVIKKRVTGRLKSGASSLAKKAVMTAVRKYLPHIFHMTAEQILFHGAKVGDALKNLFVNPKFKRWAIAKIKPFLKRFKITSVEDLLGLWCYQEKCENKLGMSASYGWATSEKAIRDWRRPYTGVYSRLVRKAMELTDSRNNGVINLLAKTCNSIKTVSGKETPHDFSRAAYEQASMAYPVMDTAQLVQNFKHKKHSKEQSKLKVYVIKALPKFWRRVASGIQPLTNPKSGILEHRIEELDAPSFSCYPDMYKEVVSYLFKPFSMKKPFKQFTTATEYVSLPNRTIHWGCPDAIPKVDTTDPNNPVLSWISSGKVDDLISGYHKKFPEFEPLSMPPVKGQVLCKDDGAGKCAKDIGVQCVVEITQQLSTCDTCCCKDGLVKTSMESNLIYGEKNMCAGYFAGIDSAMRIYAGMSRLSVTATSTKDICMDHKLLALSNAEVCQRFKCNKDVLQTFPEDPQKAHKIPPYELDKLCRDTVCGK